MALYVTYSQQKHYHHEGGRSCVEFSTEQYHHIYKSNFLENVNASLFYKIAEWEDENNICCNWNRYQQKITL